MRISGWPSGAALRVLFRLQTAADEPGFDDVQLVDIS